MHVGGRLLHLFGLVAVGVVLATFGCANRPVMAPIRGDLFSQQIAPIKSLYVVCYLPIEYREAIAEPLLPALISVFAEEGINVQGEIQNVRRLALDSGIDFRSATSRRPQAILIVKLGEASYSSAGFARWNTTFDLIDQSGKGIWRGTAEVMRLDRRAELAQSIAKDLVRALGEAKAISLVQRGGDK